MYRHPHNISDDADSNLYAIVTEDSINLVAEYESFEPTEDGDIRKVLKRSPIMMTRSELQKLMFMVDADDQEEGGLQ